MKRDVIWGTKMALVVIDPQRKFSLSVPDWEDRMVNAVKGMNAMSDVFRKNGCPVLFIHFDGSSHTGYEGDDADAWLPGLNVEDKDIVVHKQHMNCFKETVLEEKLRELGIDCVLFAGMLTEYCVMTTYFAAAERGFYPFMAADSTICYDPKGNEAAGIICNVVDTGVVDRFLRGDQPPLDLAGM
ncbi:MAG: cysteine hydrolase [Thermoplasmata archaeon]|nr:cysteine hydrolase [Thermoplasmata archaeon]